MKTLDQLKPGTHATIKRVHGSGATYQRLLEMGLLAGTPFTVVRYAPLGDPMEIRLHGFNLSLRASEAAKVEIADA